MSEDAVSTMKLEHQSHAEFMAEAEAAHQPASQGVQPPMRESGQQQRHASEFDESVLGEAAARSVSTRARVGRSDDKVDPGVAPRRSGAVGT